MTKYLVSCHRKRDQIPIRRTTEIATLFDPMGWIAPIIVKAKILVQEVWALRNAKNKPYDWDEALPSSLLAKWLEIKQRMMVAQSVKIPRWVNTSEKTTIQIHGFCDASEKAFAACVYIRAVNDNHITTQLLVSKTKNAPSQTIPKLELCVLLSKRNVQENLKIHIEKAFLWCDSKIVLAWIAADPRRFKTFVSTRINEIKTLRDVTWGLIPGIINPADCASRGIFGEINKFDTDKEIKTNALVSIQEKSMLPQVSSIYKMKRVFVYVLRFINYIKNRKNNSAPITLQELENATKAIVKITQYEHFSEELELLNSGKNLNKSAVKNLCVFKDNNSLLRVGGRLIMQEYRTT